MDNERKLSHVDIYTDGSCLKAYSCGGYAYCLIFAVKNEMHYIIVDGSFKNTTNNRMEMTAIIKALKRLTRRCEVNIYTDSRLVTDMYNNHIIDKWRACNFRRNGRRIKNEDLWRILVKETDKHEVTFEWVKGHSGNEYNELCDEFAYTAARRLYERSKKGL